MPAELFKPPNVFRILGIFFLFIAALSTLTGKTSGRTRRMISRAEEPRNFWWIVVIYFAAGVGFIEYFVLLTN
jgi:hypothetical protein